VGTEAIVERADKLRGLVAGSGMRLLMSSPLVDFEPSQATESPISSSGTTALEQVSPTAYNLTLVCLLA